MKNYNYLKSLFLTLLLSAMFISCSDEDGGDDVTPVDPLDTQGNLLNGTWKVKDANSVTKDGSIGRFHKHDPHHIWRFCERWKLQHFEF